MSVNCCVVPELEIFKRHCQPVFVMISQGKPVSFVHGSRTERLKEMMAREMELEMSGQPRTFLDWEQTVPERDPDYWAKDEELRLALVAAGEEFDYVVQN